MYKRQIGWGSLVLVVVHGVTWDLARWEDGRFLADPRDMVAVGAGEASLFRVSLLADMAGSYLLLIPLAVLWWRRLGDRGGWLVDTATVAGLVFAAAGAVAAAVVAVAGEGLIREYAAAPPAAGGARAAASSSFATLMDGGLAVWQVAGLLAGALWWLVVGWLAQADHRWFGRFSVAFGAASAFVVVGRAVGVDYEMALPMTPAFAVVGVWAAWAGSVVDTWSPRFGCTSGG